jgi:regulator of protease activity HflC (stomatin/prohibitin superfamily)
MVTKAEGEKQSMILQAEARLEAAQRDASAQVTLAEASAEAIKRVTQAIGDQEGPMRYMLGEKYIMAMTKLADSANAKTILIPGDLQEALRSVLGRKA